MLFIFGIIDVTIDTEHLSKKIFDFVDYGPKISKKGPRHTQNIDLVSEHKSGLVKFSVFDFGKFDIEYMSYVLTYGV